MSPTRIVLLVLVTVLAAPSSALAQDDDDLLAPLTPQPTKPSRSKAGKTKVVKKKRTSAPKKPARTRTSVRGKGKGKKQQAAPPEDDLLAPLAPPKTELMARITGNVRGARLLVDGRDVGMLTAAPVPVELPPGEHTVVVRKPGYAEYSRRIQVKEGAQTELAVSLEATMGFGTLTADVPGAVALVDGEEVGPVPQGNVLLKPGSREIEFRAPGFKPDVRNITVFAGRNYEVAGELRPLVDTSVALGDAPKNPDLTPGVTPDTAPDPLAAAEVPEVGTGKPWYGRWYVWAGVGAVVAAGTVGAVMASQGGVPPALTPDEVCGGNCDGVVGGVRPVRGGGLPLPAGAFRF